MDDLDEFFAQVAEDQQGHDWKLRERAMSLMDNSTQRNDEGLEFELLEMDISPKRWEEIFTQLNLNQLRPFDRGNWSPGDLVKFYKKTREKY